jgi:hypothetical protein
MPVTGVDLSNGPNKGTLYVNWIDARNGDQDVFVMSSRDGGDTWSAPRRVELFGTSPSLHLTSKGRLLAGYRSTREGGRCHISSSEDGGLTWKFELELEPPGGTWASGGYPAFENLPDGRLFVTFHTGKPPAWHTYYNVIEER